MAMEMFQQFNDQRRQQFKKETGLDVPPPEELLNDKSVFEKIQINETIEIENGVQLEKGSVALDSEGSFVNYYDISVDCDNNISVDLFSFDTPLHLKRILQNNPDIIAVTNGGFFYLSDEHNLYPKNSNYQLDIRSDGIHGLPVADRPFLYMKDGQLCVKEISAQGTVLIDNISYSWRGAQTKHEAQIVLYTSASSVISQESSLITDSKRISLSVHTPQIKDMIDVVIDRGQSGFLMVKEIRPSGETLVQEGVGVLQLPSNAQVVKGSLVKISNISNLDLSAVSVGFSIGPDVFHFINNDDHEINYDASLGGNPPFNLNRIARNIIYKDFNKKIHIRLFDGVPKSNICRGLTPQEVAEIFKKIPVEWAYHLDGGQSAKLVTRERNTIDSEKKLVSYGNKHYVRWPKKDSHPFLWDPDGGRKVPSGILFKKLK